MTSGVYAIVNTVDGMAYIGSSVNIEARWQSHRSFMKNGYWTTLRLMRAWHKVDGIGFELRILEEVPADADLLMAAEQAWIDRYGDLVYNTDRRAKRYPRRQRRQRPPMPPASGQGEGEL